MFEEYQKGIPDLVISESIRLREENRKKEEKIKKYEAKDLEIEKLKTRMECIERLSEIVSVSRKSENS